jgi:GGDEF domain-containing protein
MCPRIMAFLRLHYEIQSHQQSLYFVPSNSAACDFLYMSNTLFPSHESESGSSYIEPCVATPNIWSPEEMRKALLVSDKTGLPNRRAFDEAETSSFVAMIDVNGLKALNDRFGYSAGDVLIRRLADTLLEVGLDAYHDKGDEFLCKGKSYRDLNRKLSKAFSSLQFQPFAVCGLDGRITTINGADFCFGIGTNLEEAEKSLKHQKELCKVGQLKFPFFERENTKDGK